MGPHTEALTWMRAIDSDPTPPPLSRCRFGYCNGLTRELEREGYEHMGPGYYDAVNPNFTPLHEASDLPFPWHEA